MDDETKKERKSIPANCPTGRSVPSYFESYFSLATIDIKCLPEYRHQIESCLRLYPQFAHYLYMRAQILTSTLEKETLIAMIERDNNKVERGIQLILKRRTLDLRLVNR